MRASPALGTTTVLNLVLKREENARLGTPIALVDQYGTSFQQFPVPFQCQVENGRQERVPRTDKGRGRLARHRQQRLLESDTFVAGQNRLAHADLPIAVTYRGRYVTYLVASRFALACGAAEVSKCLEGRTTR